MRYCLLLILLFISLPVSAQNAAVLQNTAQDKVLVSNILIGGFVLEDKSQFVKLFKPYRIKHLSVLDVNTILEQLEEIYEQAGYQGLVSIDHRLAKRTLTFTVTLIR
jgi:hypothetical protein